MDLHQTLLFSYDTVSSTPCLSFGEDETRASSPNVYIEVQNWILLCLNNDPQEGHNPSVPLAGHCLFKASMAVIDQIFQ